MNYTKNYRLPQWVKEDRIMMDDFNAMNNSIEAGLTRTAAQAAQASNKADTAVQTANSAASAALACSYVVGHYTGTGQNMEITLGFRPSFVVISGMQGTSVPNSYKEWVLFFGISGGHALNGRLALTDNGFTVYNGGGSISPDYTANGHVFDYIAFR